MAERDLKLPLFIMRLSVFYFMLTLLCGEFPASSKLSSWRIWRC